MKKEIPTKVNKNYDFPLTSPFGGRVTYTSSNEEVLSNSGVVKEVNEPVIEETKKPEKEGFEQISIFDDLDD